MKAAQDYDLAEALFKIGDKTVRAVKTDLVFRTPFGDSAIDFALFKIGDALIPTFYLRDLEVTKRWLDYCLRENIKAWGDEIVSPDLINAGEVLTAAEAAKTAR